MKKTLLLSVLLVLAFGAFAQDVDKLMELINNHDWLNVILYVLLSSVGALGVKAVRDRDKIKQLGEICMKLHEYTDDNILDETEREDLLNRVVKLLGPKLAALLRLKVVENSSAVASNKDK